MFLDLILLKGYYLLFLFCAGFLSFCNLLFTKVCFLFLCWLQCCNFCCYAPSPRWVSTFQFHINLKFWLVQIITDIIRLLQLLLLLILLILLLSCQGRWTRGVTGFQLAFQCFWDLNSFKTPKIFFLPPKKGFAFWDVGGRSRGRTAPLNSAEATGHTGKQPPFPSSSSSSFSSYYLLPLPPPSHLTLSPSSSFSPLSSYSSDLMFFLLSILLLLLLLNFLLLVQFPL